MKKTEKNIAELLARKLAKESQGYSVKKGEKSPVIDLSPTNLPLLVNLENLSSSVKEIDLFGLDAFAWYKARTSHYVQVNDVLSLVIRPDSTGHILYAVFPKAGFYAPLLDEPVEFNLAYGCGNAYLFDYGDRHLATKNSHWRNGEPTEIQRNLFQRLRDKVKDMSAGSISFAEPRAKKGEYGAAIAALNAEMVLLGGRKMKSEEARQLIRQNFHAPVAGEQPIAVTINGQGDANTEMAVRRAIGTFLHSVEGTLLNYLKRIFLENEIILDGNCATVRHVKFPRHMTEKQLDAVRERIGEEIHLYAPDTEIAFVEFPIPQKGDEKLGSPVSKRPALLHGEIES